MTGIRVRTGKITPTYLIEYLLSSHIESEVAKTKDLGTIMDSLNVKGIVRLNVPCPPLEVMQKFESIARPIRQRRLNSLYRVDEWLHSRSMRVPRHAKRVSALQREASASLRCRVISGTTTGLRAA